MPRHGFVKLDSKEYGTLRPFCAYEQVKTNNKGEVCVGKYGTPLVQLMWECDCTECKDIHVVENSKLLGGYIKSGGCVDSPNYRGKIEGTNLFAVKSLGTYNKNKYWLVICDDLEFLQVKTTDIKELQKKAKEELERRQAIDPETTLADITVRLSICEKGHKQEPNFVIKSPEFYSTVAWMQPTINLDRKSRGLPYKMFVDIEDIPDFVTYRASRCKYVEKEVKPKKPKNKASVELLEVIDTAKIEIFEPVKETVKETVRDFKVVNIQQKIFKVPECTVSQNHLYADLLSKCNKIPIDASSIINNYSNNEMYEFRSKYLEGNNFKLCLDFRDIDLPFIGTRVRDIFILAKLAYKYKEGDKLYPLYLGICCCGDLVAVPEYKLLKITNCGCPYNTPTKQYKVICDAFNKKNRDYISIVQEQELRMK